MKSITIRAHHLLCFQGFQGYGYSADFVKNMARLVDEIHAAPQNMLLKLVVGQDDFCTACPHHGGSRCNKDADADSRMRAMDTAALAALKLTPNMTDTAEKLIALSNQILKTQHDVALVCGRCEWREKCRWYGALTAC